jgi:hypothetical protein
MIAPGSSAGTQASSRAFESTASGTSNSSTIAAEARLYPTRLCVMRLISRSSARDLRVWSLLRLRDRIRRDGGLVNRTVRRGHADSPTRKYSRFAHRTSDDALISASRARRSETPSSALELGPSPAKRSPQGLISRVLRYFKILATTPAPTVRPPSRIAKRRPSSIAIGTSSVTSIDTLSPGITISVPSGSFTEPVTSVVRK